jgi:hypothetical protein
MGRGKMKKLTVILIIFGLALFALLNASVESYAGQATATASIIIIIPPREAKSVTVLAEEETKDDANQEGQQQLASAKVEAKN